MIPLDTFQQDAVDYSGNAYLMAGPGAGKTRTVAAKIEQVLGNGSALSEILSLSFSNQAADEIVKRLPSMASQVKTIHSFANSLLKTKYGVIPMKRNPEAWDTRKRVMLTYQMGKDLLWAPKIWKQNPDLREAANDTLGAIDKFKSTPDSKLPSLYQEPYKVYQAYLKENNLIDFNDMLSYAIEEIEKNPVTKKWIFLDEGHDTSMLQYELLKRIKTDHIWAVFSPHQMIYRWNGADERNMQRFIADYNPKEFKLLNNWRSNKAIVDALEEIYKDNLIPKNSGQGKFEVMPVDLEEESSLLNELLSGPGDFEILARVHYKLPKISGDGLKVDTIHGSKGSEADTVIVLGCGDGLLPLRRSSDLEEERNLLYVAMSRAKKNLYLLYNYFPCPWLLGGYEPFTIRLSGGYEDDYDN